MKYKLLLKTIENIKKLCYNKKTIQKNRNNNWEGEINMKYTALDIAKYIAKKCTDDFNAISNLQLQKILYFVQGGYYRQTGKFLFDEDFQSWQYGPVIETVYSEYSWYGGSKIYEDEEPKVVIDAESKKIVDEILEEKRRIPAFELVNETHKIGGAWDLTFRDGLGRGAIITKERIKDEFNN